MSDTPDNGPHAADQADLCARLAAAGVSDAQIRLALETSGTLLDQLAAYPLDDRHKRTVLQIFEAQARSIGPDR